MYLLDTNVLSELRKLGSRHIDQNVERWARRANGRLFYVATITLYEIELGVLAVERRDPRQGELLRRWAQNFVYAAFKNRTIDLTADIAKTCAILNTPDRRPLNDSIIAATALDRNYIVVTRNVSDFRGTGVALIDPWAV